MPAPEPADETLFEEIGARWRVVWIGPIICVIALVVELATGPAIHWGALAGVAVILASFSALVVHASRIHVSVFLTPNELRQGDQTVPIDDIVEVIPPTDYTRSRGRSAAWESAPALGGLSNVPRKRTGIGVRLRDGTVAQAWARDHETLREKLTELVGARESD
ncbi:hypothetical protein [Millisia brevis]|uniref:hypothetical protein n=1 Tax=Millisia brevis TaxID=264148 RepID=UPI0008350E86|nr:hypothetical protein [Millisia brevis]